jgi:hypothetical protein
MQTQYYCYRCSATAQNKIHSGFHDLFLKYTLLKTKQGQRKALRIPSPKNLTLKINRVPDSPKD